MKWTWIHSENQPLPPVTHADADGLVAVGGVLTIERLEEAYTKGIFPWYSEEQPVLWWSPDPRLVLYPENLKIQKSMRPLLNQDVFKVTINRCFDDVISACAGVPRKDQDGTWILDELREVYSKWHQLGKVHSFEAWENDELVGGFYGVQQGAVFFGESMFATKTNASKFAFIKGVQWLKSKGVRLIDCQQETEHLKRFGAENVPRSTFIEQLSAWKNLEVDLSGEHILS